MLMGERGGGGGSGNVKGKEGTGGTKVCHRGRV